MNEINDKHIARKEAHAQRRRLRTEQAKRNCHSLDFHQVNIQTELNEQQEP